MSNFCMMQVIDRSDQSDLSELVGTDTHIAKDTGGVVLTPSGINAPFKHKPKQAASTNL